MGVPNLYTGSKFCHGVHGIQSIAADGETKFSSYNTLVASTSAFVREPLCSLRKLAGELHSYRIYCDFLIVYFYVKKSAVFSLAIILLYFAALVILNKYN